MTDTASIIDERLNRTIHQQQRAADPLSSAWVSANAGSGKTKVLTDRVTRLLLEGNDPSKILCLTYTKAAASEMANRLFQQLGQWATESDEILVQRIEALEGEKPGRARLISARRLFARALEAPGGLKVQTIHAFCQSLLGRFPIEAGVPVHFTVLDERHVTELLAEARFHLFERAAEEVDTPFAEAVDRLVERLDLGGLLAVLEHVVALRGKLNRWFDQEGGVDGACATLRRHVDIAPDESDEELVSQSLSTVDAAKQYVKRAVDALAEGGKTDQRSSQVLTDFLEADLQDADYEEYLSIFLTKEGQPRKRLITKAAKAADPTIETWLLDEQARLCEVEARRRIVWAVEASEDLFAFSESLFEQYEKTKHIRGVLDYDDLIEKTRTLLQEREDTAWVLFKLDGGIDHILIDEAQDTSPAQWSVIEAITEEFFAGLGAHEERHEDQPRTVFAVGDEKQSIYSFQGADPNSFGRMRSYFKEKIEAANSNFSDISLVLSFRSVEQVLSAVDQVFSVETARAALTRLEQPIQHEAHRIGVSGLVEIWPTKKPEPEEPGNPWDAPLDRPVAHSPRALLADQIADNINAWLEGPEPSHPGGPPLSPGDVLILVQRRNSFVDEMIRALKKKNIPVAGRDRMMLTEQMAVMDLIALGEFALLPEDDLILATVIKSPLIGLNEEDLFEIAYNRSQSLWQSLKSHAQREPYSHAYTFLANVLARVEIVRPFEFFSTALGVDAGSSVSGRERMIARLGYEAADPIDEFLNLALDYERLEVATLQGFINWIKHDASQIKREFDTDSGEVRIMTVHGAKGLEAPIVILPDTCSIPSQRNDPELIELDAAPTHEDGGPFLWRQNTNLQDHHTAAARERLSQQRRDEHHRLLYVAMTRAQDRLYIAGYETKRGRDDGCWYDLATETLSPMMAEHTIRNGDIRRLAGSDWDRVSDRPIGAGEDLVVEDSSSVTDIDLPVWAHIEAKEEHIIRPESPSQLVASEEEVYEPPISSPLLGQSDNRFKRGRLIHRLLEILPEHAVDDRARVAKAFLQEPMNELNDDEINNITSEVLTVLDHPEFAPLFGAGSLAEAAISGRLPGSDLEIRGQVDRLCVTDQKVLVIDYKTNRPPPKTPEKVAPVYYRQMAAYKVILGSLYPKHEVHCALLWTDGPTFMTLPETLLNAALAQISSL